MRLVERTMAIAAAVFALAVTLETQGAGLLVPKDESVPPLAVKYLRVDATIDNQAATTRVVQEFQNSTSSNLECTYIFPLPRGAAIREFAMYIGGKRMTGELVEAVKARQVYEEIVRRTRDPGLLEYMDGSLLRMRVFPVPANGTQKVEVEYTQLVPMDSGLAEYVFPLRVGDKASKTLEDFTVAVRIRSGSKIKSVYSPTHEIGVARPSDHEAVAGVETKGALLDRDFHLFYTVSEQDFGLNLMTYRPDGDKPGMFLLLVSPRSEVNERERAPRDVVFVLDTSGSMKGEKLDQAKKALRFCIEKLDRKDRFSIVQFSTMAQTFAPLWTEAADENRRKACEWVNAFEAGGGTNISEALQKVFALPADDARATTIFFVTDGRPTVDTTDTEALLKMVKQDNKRNLRLFTFGVGDDVNTHLLDRMAEATGGLPDYVRPTEAIDGKVTRLYAKMSHPVLTDLAIEIPGVKIVDLFPRQLPDLFRGSQVVLIGSYTGDGDSVIRLRGRVGQKKEEFTYEGTFPKKTAERAFIGSLYANRKIGFLLDQIRLHGEEKELKDEVIRLSLAYGIETPYTSYLVLENEQQYRQYGIESGGGGRTRGVTTFRSGGAGHASVPPDRSAPADISGGVTIRGDGVTGPPPLVAETRPTPSEAPAVRAKRATDRLEGTFNFGIGGAASPARPSFEPAKPDAASSSPGGRRENEARGGAGQAAGQDTPAWNGDVAGGGVRANEEDFKAASSGKTAVDIAQQVQRLRQSEKVARRAQAVAEKGGRRLVNYRGVWVDEKFDGSEKLTKVKWGSEAYFRLIRDRAALREAFSLGQRIVVVTARGQAVAVDPDEGAEKLTDEEVKALFTDAPAASK